MPNPWDDDPIVEPTPKLQAGRNPWDDDPIIRSAPANAPSHIETGPVASKIGSEFMKTVNPWGPGPDWYNAASDYASKNYIPGPVLQGRGLPKGTEAEKA